MIRIFVLLVLLVSIGCGKSREEVVKQKVDQEQQDRTIADQIAAQKAQREQEEAIFRAKLESLKMKKILNIRGDINSDTFDFILEDGSIVTIFSYTIDRRVANIKTWLGVK